MSDVTTLTDNLIPVAQEAYSDNLSASISSLATSVPVNSAAAYDDGDVVVLVVEPGTTNEAVFTGVKASAPDRFTDVKWTEGNTGVGHASGATVVDYVTATHLNMLSKAMRTHANQDGTLKEDAVRTALGLGSSSLNGWNPLAYNPSSVTYNGNRNYSLAFSGQDITPTISNGMRFRTTRTTNAPVMCASLNGTSQYFSKASPTGMTFTDDFVVSAWVKLSSYADGTIASRWNGTSGWSLELNSDGTVDMFGTNGGSANISRLGTYQSVPLNKWTHITGQLDMSTFTSTSTTSYVMFDGVDVPISVSRSGTNPTALVQAGNLEIGSRNGGTQPFPGKIAQVAIFSAKVAQATMRGYISQGLLGSETSLVSAFSLSNTLNDLNTTNANNLTANGGALTTTADSPFGVDDDGVPSATLDYGIVMDKSLSGGTTTLIVQVPEGCTIPTSGGVSAVSYATDKSPFGFPSDRFRWVVESLHKILSQQTAPTNLTWYNIGSFRISVPTGNWNVSYKVSTYINRPSGEAVVFTTLSTTTSSDSSGGDFTARSSAVGQADYTATHTVGRPIPPVSSSTDFYLLEKTNASVSGLYVDAREASAIISAEPAYL